MDIIEAKHSDIKVLNELTKASKAHWGYSSGLMNLWDEELTITVNDMQLMHFYKAVINKKVIAYYAYIEEGDRTLRLENFFVLPQYMGKGIGSQLINDFFNRVSDFNVVILYSDPNAEAFYQSHGFKTIGKKPTSIEDRYLPIMQKILSAAPDHR